MKKRLLAIQNDAAHWAAIALATNFHPPGYMAFPTNPSQIALLSENVKNIEDRLIFEGHFFKCVRVAEAALSRKRSATIGGGKPQDAAKKRAAEIKKVYKKLKNENHAFGRRSLIAETVKHFQATLKKPRKYYGNRTVEAATVGL